MLSWNLTFEPSYFTLHCTWFYSIFFFFFFFSLYFLPDFFPSFHLFVFISVIGVIDVIIIMIIFFFFKSSLLFYIFIDGWNLYSGKLWKYLCIVIYSPLFKIFITATYWIKLCLHELNAYKFVPKNRVRFISSKYISYKHSESFVKYSTRKFSFFSVCFQLGFQNYKLFYCSFFFFFHFKLKVKNCDGKNSHDKSCKNLFLTLIVCYYFMINSHVCLWEWRKKKWFNMQMLITELFN